MTDRERWIIYPLLFFALALAARGQTSHLPIVGRFDTVVCRDLRIVSHNGRTGGAKMVAIAGARNEQGLVLRFDGNQQMLLTPKKVVRSSRVVVKSVDPQSPAEPKESDKDGQDPADSEADKESDESKKDSQSEEPAPPKDSPATDDPSL